MTTGVTYRQTPQYRLVYDKLLSAARAGTQVFHTEVAEALAEPDGEHGTAQQVGLLLREIAEDEHAAGRPLLTALVLTGKSIPGAVFFSVARAVGSLSSSDPAEEMKFWMAERARVYETWKPPSG